MGVVVYHLSDPRRPGGRVPGSGAALSISDRAAQRIRDALGATTGTLHAEHLPMLRELADASVVDADLELVAGAIEAHGAVELRLI